MATALTVFILILFILLLAAGIVLVPLGLPGTWLIVLDALLYAVVRDYDTKDWKVVTAVGAMALLGEAIEFVSNLVGAKREKVPNGAIVASLVGGLLGALIGLPIILIGSVLGLLLGTFLGALLYSLLTVPHVNQALRIAFATLFSRVVSISLKTAVAVVMAIYLLLKVFS